MRTSMALCRCCSTNTATIAETTTRRAFGSRRSYFRSDSTKNTRIPIQRRTTRLCTCKTYWAQSRIPTRRRAGPLIEKYYGKQVSQAEGKQIALMRIMQINMQVQASNASIDLVGPRSRSPIWAMKCLAIPRHTTQSRRCDAVRDHAKSDHKGAKFNVRSITLCRMRERKTTRFTRMKLHRARPLSPQMT